MLTKIGEKAIKSACNSKIIHNQKLALWQEPAKSKKVANQLKWRKKKLQKKNEKILRPHGMHNKLAKSAKKTFRKDQSSSGRRKRNLALPKRA